MGEWISCWEDSAKSLFLPHIFLKNGNVASEMKVKFNSAGRLWCCTGNICKGFFITSLSSQKISCKYRSSSADSHISLLTPARGQAKQNTILVFFSFFYFAPPKHSFSDIWHFSWKSFCKESLPSDVHKIFSVAHFWFNTTWTGGGQSLVQFCRLVVLSITMFGCIFLLLRAIGTGAYLKFWFKVLKGRTDTQPHTHF